MTHLDGNTPIWLGPALPVLFVCGWLFVMNLLALMGGWRDLAESYGTSGPVDGEAFPFRSAKVGIVDYGNCVRFVAGRPGLGISVLWPFRPGHRPLVVPWCDVSASEHRGWVFEYVDFRFARQPQVQLRVSRQLADALIAAGGSSMRFAKTG